MSHAADPAPSSGTCLIFLTNCFPFAPGEEFIESEIGHVAAAFDRVLLVPVVRDISQSRQRETPENVEVILPDPLSTPKASAVTALRYALRHPLHAMAAAGRALRSFPFARRMFQDLRLDLLACIVADQVEGRIRDRLGVDTRVVLYSYWMMVPARVAVRLSPRLGEHPLPVISRAHGYDVFTERHVGDYLPQRELLLSRIQQVFTASENGAEYLRAKYPAYADRVAAGRLGVGPATAAGNPSQGSLMVYSCAYLVPVKRIPLLIEGLAVAQSRGLRVNWSHIGSGTAEYAASIKHLAADRLEDGTFAFLGDLTNDQVRAQYAAQSGGVFINVSESEGVPVSIMEALAQGLPVIATDVGGNSELIDKELGMFDGVLPSTPTAEEIADRLEALFTADPQVYDGYVRASLRHWERDWSSEKNYNAFSSLLRDAAAPL